LPQVTRRLQGAEACLFPERAAEVECGEDIEEDAERRTTALIVHAERRRLADAKANT
jgi:phage terminase Nu1 subunit (DNA packaging protein)